MQSNNDDLKINTKKTIKVYYEHNADRPKPYRLYEREGFFDSWRIVGDYKTLAEAQESGLSRAIQVTDMGLFEKGKRKGMMSWFDEPRQHSPEEFKLLRRKSYGEEIPKFEPIKPDQPKKGDHQLSNGRWTSRK